MEEVLPSPLPDLVWTRRYAKMVSDQLGLWHRCQVENASGLPEQVVEVVEQFTRANSTWP